ncbi:MAG: prepilin-type N-terminal cleavage/methylation domain-containing protein [Phycisphaerae bacterium]
MSRRPINFRLTTFASSARRVSLGCARDRLRPAAHYAPAGARRGFSLLEAVIAMVLVGLVLVAAFHVLGGTTQSTYLTAQYGTGLLLGEGLLAEVLACDYADPDQTPVFGPESGEGGNRSAFDDVDDFDGWTATPPEDATGTALAGYDGWTRTVTVAYADPNDYLDTVGSDQGIKRITVTASYGGKTMAELVAYRTDCEPDEE